MRVTWLHVALLAGGGFDPLPLRHLAVELFSEVLLQFLDVLLALAHQGLADLPLRELLLEVGWEVVLTVLLGLDVLLASRNVDLSLCGKRNGVIMLISTGIARFLEYVIACW